MLPLQACVSGAQLKLYIFFMLKFEFLPFPSHRILLFGVGLFARFFCVPTTVCNCESPLNWKGLTKWSRQQAVLSHWLAYCMP